jgi:aminomethyltransferase
MHTMASDGKKTCLYEWHRAHGAKIVEFAGWQMPLHYETGILQEHLATRKYGGMFDVSHMGRLRIGGRDALVFLQKVLSNNIEAVQEWQAQYNLVPSETGGVVDDVYLYRFSGGEYFLVVNAVNLEKVKVHFQKYRDEFKDLLIEDITEEMGMIAFQGPLSGRILQTVLSSGSLPNVQHNSLSSARISDAEVWISRTGYTGEPIGFELFMKRGDIVGVWEKLYEASRKDGVVCAGLGARDTLRIEAGMPLYGNEFGTDIDGKEIPAYAFPLTANVISFSVRKGNYTGRDALYRQFMEVCKLQSGLAVESEILPRRFRAVAMLDKGVMRHGNRVYCDGKEVGYVSSAGPVPYWEFEGEGVVTSITERNAVRSIGLAYLDAGLRDGAELEVEIHGKRRKAKVVKWHGRSDAPPYFRPILVTAMLREEKRREHIAGVASKVEILLKRALENHEWRQTRCVNLIPSEMTPSPVVRLLQITDPAGRYAEHRDIPAMGGKDIYYYQGTSFIEWVENRVIEEMANYMGCSLVEPRTLSGQMANVTVFSAFVDYKNRLDKRRERERIRLAFTNYIGLGGHLSSQPMGALRDFLAKDPVTEKHAVMYFPVCRDNPYRMDVEKAIEMIMQYKPELIILGKSMVLHREPVKQICDVARSIMPRPIVMYDMAHVFGLLGPYFQEPFKEGIDIVTASTHKTFFGTQRGIIGASMVEDSPEYELWLAIRRRAFPGMVSNHHLGTLLGLLMATLEMEAFKADYQKQVISNAKAFARALYERGIKVEGDPGIDFTETHQVIVRVGYAKGCSVAQQLEENGIIVNYQALPDDESFTASSGLRMGVAEMTRFGMKEKDFEEFAELMGDALRGKKVKDEVARFRQKFLKMQYCFDDVTTKALYERLVASVR